jgi:hypothetical protein
MIEKKKIMEIRGSQSTRVVLAYWKLKNDKWKKNLNTINETDKTLEKIYWKHMVESSDVKVIISALVSNYVQANKLHVKILIIGDRRPTRARQAKTEKKWHWIKWLENKSKNCRTEEELSDKELTQKKKCYTMSLL